jgi:hypothetical protein
MTDSISFFQLNCKRLGHHVEFQIANLAQNCPQLLRLGITMEFRDPLNRIAIILQKNLENHTKTHKHDGQWSS